MANIDNNPVDTRTFVEFCKTLTKREWVELQGELITKIQRTGQCIYNWKIGHRRPSSPSEAKAVSQHINRKFKIKTQYWTLFPDFAL